MICPNCEYEMYIESWDGWAWVCPYCEHVDIRSAVKPDRQAILDHVIDAAGKCLDQFPADEDDEIKAFERYQSWTI